MVDATVPIQVRAFAPGDFEASYRLDQACYPPGIAYSRDALREFLTLPGSNAWVAVEEQGALVGLVIVRRVRRDRGYIITLDVREDRRRQGIGRRLLAAAEEWFREQGVKRVRLEAAMNNPAAVTFWQNAGFEVVGRLPRYYLDQDDAYRMEKGLS